MTQGQRGRSRHPSSRRGWRKELVVAYLAAVAIVATFGVASASAADRSSHDATKATIAKQFEDANDRQRANAPKGDKNDPAQALPLAAGGVVAWDQGVLDTQEAPIPKGVITVTSMWGQTIGDNHFAVYAGAVADNQAQGLIVVQTYSLAGEHLADEDYPTPAGVDMVQIVSAQGHSLTLRSRSGARLVFDFDKRAFG